MEKKNLGSSQKQETKERQGINKELLKLYFHVLS